ncbi:MAG: hypothetical protein P1P84_05190 [Deferrisomatales bacterium]|nr:hypothetical protein [Deferrisomatales bacterium]
MPPTGNPRKYARDIAEGYVLLSPVPLRGYLPGDLATLKQALELTLRDLRSEVPSADDLPAVQARHRKILRANQGLRVLRTYCLKRRIAV